MLAVMTAYNRINGPFAADSEPLLRGVLRGEWGFDGLVMSDWFGLHSTTEALAAGLDLEMPGPTRCRGQALLDAVERGDVTCRAGSRRGAATCSPLMDRVGALATEGPGPELTRDDPDDRALDPPGRRRRAWCCCATSRTRRARPTLPLASDELRRVAVIGPNAAVGQIMGGGSAHVTPTHVIHPLDAIVERLRPHRGRRHPRRRVQHQSKGSRARPPAVRPGRRSTTSSIPTSSVKTAPMPDRTSTTGTGRIKWVADPVGRDDANPEFGARLSTTFTPDVPGSWAFGVESVAPARLLLDGRPSARQRRRPRRRLVLRPRSRRRSPGPSSSKQDGRTTLDRRGSPSAYRHGAGWRERRCPGPPDRRRDGRGRRHRRRLPTWRS